MQKIKDKSELNKIFKELGYGFVKWNTEECSEKGRKTHPAKRKGFQGASSGPLTAFPYLIEKNNRQIQSYIIDHLLNYDGVKCEFNSLGHLKISVEFENKKTFETTLEWTTFSSYSPKLNYDSMYRTWWLVNYEVR